MGPRSDGSVAGRVRPVLVRRVIVAREQLDDRGQLRMPPRRRVDEELILRGEEHVGDVVAQPVDAKVVAKFGVDRTDEADHRCPHLSGNEPVVAQAALLASILHEDPERLTSLREELRGLGVPLRDAA